jgi:hypothetical protein
VTSSAVGLSGSGRSHLNVASLITIAVPTAPGWTVLTRFRRGPSSLARVRARRLAAPRSAKLVCATFAVSNGDPFGDVGWCRAHDGAPRLHAALVFIEADFEYERGCTEDTVVVAHVTAVHAPLIDDTDPPLAPQAGMRWRVGHQHNRWNH